MRGSRMLWSNAVISVAAAGCVLRSWSLSHPAESEASVPWLFATGIGAATWLAYTWQRHVKSTRPNGLRSAHLVWLRAHKKTLKWVAVLLGPLALAPLAQTAATAETTMSTALLLFFGLCAAGLLTLLYAGLPGIRGVQLALRRMPRLKLLWIGLTWSVITALWPALLGADITSFERGTLILIAAERALVIMALTLPFDLRDRNWDPASMKTLASTLGHKRNPNHSRGHAPRCRMGIHSGIRWKLRFCHRATHHGACSCLRKRAALTLVFRDVRRRSRSRRGPGHGLGLTLKKRSRPTPP